MTDAVSWGVDMKYADYVQNNTKKTECEGALHINCYVQIQRAVNYINAHYTEQITLDKICKVVAMSQSAFTNSFKRIVGKTLIEYVHTLRVDLAKKLLQNTNLNITSVSEQCGFGDSTYFGRVFKKYTEMTPKEYKASKKGS